MTLFSDLPLSNNTQKALSDYNYNTMTDIQLKSIPLLLKNKNVIINTSTGSGKTLCFVIPTIEYLFNNNKTDGDGVSIVVITPTRELALQIFEVYGKILKYHNISTAIITGGTDKKLEEKNIRKGSNILVCTPGRLLDHLNTLENDKNYNINPQIVIIDEVDKMFEIGFKTEIKNILKYFNYNQMILSSATLSDEVIKFSNKLKNLKIIESKDQPNILEYFGVVTEDRKIDFLFSILKKKTIVFFSSCNEVNFYYEIFKFLNFNVFMLHGKLKQCKRTNTYLKYIKNKEGILFCTDVGARGLDFSDVQRIIHYGLPTDINEYKHRIGRTGRNGKEGKSIAILTPSEIKFIEDKENIKELKISKLKNFSPKLVKMVKNNFLLKRLSMDALKSFLEAYNSRKDKDKIDVNNLNLEKLAVSFGYDYLPKLDIYKKTKTRR